VKRFQRPMFFISLLLLILVTSCTPIKNLHEWKDPAYTKTLHNTLIIARVEQEYMRNQFENFLTHQFNSLGIAAIPSYKVMPHSATEITRDEVVEKVHQLGVDSVLVIRSIMQESIINYQPGGAYYAATATSGAFGDGWYTVYVGAIVFPMREYDIDYFTLSTQLFDVESKKPIWSDLSRIKVSSSSRQAAINKFVPFLVRKLNESQLLE